MYEMFASWYSQVWPRNPQRLRERWHAVESLVETLGAEAVLDYVALAFGCGENSPTRQVIRDAAIRFDQSYVPSKDEHELSLLASAVVAHGLGDGPAISDVLALAIVCVQFGRSIYTPIQRHLAAMCCKYLSERMISGREGQTALRIHPIEMHDVRLLRSETATQGRQQTSQELQTEHFETLLLATCRFSTLIDKPFRAVRKAEAVSLAAYELAALTKFSPGLSRHSAVLDTLLRESTGRASVLSVGDVVKAASSELERGLTSCVRTMPQLFPCQFGIALWGKTNDEHMWQEAFLRSTSLNPEARYPLLQLARQSYLEQILCSTLAAVQRLGNKTHALATSQGSRG